MSKTKRGLKLVGIVIGSIVAGAVVLSIGLPIVVSVGVIGLAGYGAYVLGKSIYRGMKGCSNCVDKGCHPETNQTNLNPTNQQVNNYANHFQRSSSNEILTSLGGTSNPNPTNMTYITVPIATMSSANQSNPTTNAMFSANPGLPNEAGVLLETDPAYNYDYYRNTI